MNVAGAALAPLGRGGTEHAESITHAASMHAAEKTMEWVVLEALVALAAGLAIVWWTMSPARRREREDECREAGKDDSPGDTSRSE